MRKFNLIIFLISIILAINVCALENFKILDGFRVKLGMKHILRWDARRMGDPDQDGYYNSDVPVAFEPEDFVQLSIGAEYLYPLSDSFAIGLGYEYNSIMRVSKFYHNNALSKSGSKQLEKKYYSHNPLYLVLKYNFEKSVNLNPYLIARLGYSFNKLNYTHAYWKYEGPEPGDGYAVLLSTVKPVDDLKTSPYFGFGFGIEVGDHAYFEGVYSYTYLNYSNHYEMFTSSPTYTVNEEYKTDLHNFQFYIGYKFAKNTPKPAGGFIGQHYKIEGFNISLGINKSLQMDGDLTHKPGFLNHWNESIFSIQDITYSPDSVVVPNINLEYLFSIVGDFYAGVGVSYDFVNEYTLEKKYVPDSNIRIDKLTNFTSIIPYAVLKWRFFPMKTPAPYLIGRIGYSLNSFDYSKIQGGVELERGGAKNIKNGTYFGLGFGMKLTQHLFTEMVYGTTRTAWDVKYEEELGGKLYAQVEAWETTMKFFHITMGYNF
ncbi:outer membrane beta-barrel protein [Candidatus Dependentiae bacterium]|nr:outer membrane beta-barrel protein [Candidatus Dependentiae bacterium]